MSRASDEIVIGGKRVKNRITMSPTVKFDYAGDDGKATEKHIEHYRERAKGGCGLICVEATAVTPDGRFWKNHMGLWEDAQIDGHKEIVKACHDEGVVVILQINHTGITSNPDCGEAIGPSAVETRNGGTSRAMTVDEIKAIQRAFVDVALRAKRAGYDGIQLHGCHGYLINQFIAKKTNLRTDEYGGSVENRARFAAEIIGEIRKECGDDFIISVRTAGADPELQDAIEIAEEYVKAGCDYLQVSHGMGEIEPSAQIEGAPFNIICSLGVRFHEHFTGRVPVSCANELLEPSVIRYIFENDLADTVDLARAVLADPEFPLAVMEEGRDYVKCFKCPRCQYGPGMPHKCPAETKRKANK